MAKNKYNIDPRDVSGNKNAGGSRKYTPHEIVPPKPAPTPEPALAQAKPKKSLADVFRTVDRKVAEKHNKEAEARVAKKKAGQAKEQAMINDIVFQKPTYTQGGFTKSHYDLGRISRLSKQELEAKTSPKYDEMRRQAEALGQTQLTGQQSAMERRLARLGGGPAGFAEKQQALAQQTMQEQVAGAKGDIAAQQEAEVSALDEAEAARQFATTQQMAQQAFQRGEQIDSQNFQRMERLSAERAQTLAANYANLEKLREQGKQLKNSAAIAKMEMAIKNEEADWQKVVDEFNMEMAQSELNRKDMFARLGDSGTDIWKSLFPHDV